MSHTAEWSAGPVNHSRLLALVRSVAHADRHAFTRLYHALAPTIATELCATVPNPADVAAISSATFVEVWWLARFHTAPDTDVSAWITGIAVRRAVERIPTRTVDDQRNEIALAVLLDHPAANLHRASFHAL
jgi:DNA-directed RNA polymerase specialized sigma24 family protein